MSLRNKPIELIHPFSRQSSIARWREFFSSNPPRRIGSASLTLILAQAQRESNIGSSMRILEKRLAAFTDPASIRGLSKTELRIGDRIIRRWGGVKHQVTVLPKGFLYLNETYMSLSEIARHITGARWSGPRFFRVSGEGV